MTINDVDTKFAKTLEALREVNANAAIHTTGGGCLAIRMPLGEGFERSILITGAWQEDGEWFTDAALPDEENDDTRWAVGIDSEETVDDEPTLPLTLAELVRWCDARITLDYIEEEHPDWDGDFASLHETVDANDYLLTAFERSGGGEAGIEEASKVIALIEQLHKGEVA